MKPHDLAEVLSAMAQSSADAAKQFAEKGQAQLAALFAMQASVYAAGIQRCIEMHDRTAAPRQHNATCASRIYQNCKCDCGSVS